MAGTSHRTGRHRRDDDDQADALSAARHAFREIYPDATAHDANRAVASLADAMFVRLQREGLLRRRTTTEQALTRQR